MLTEVILFYLCLKLHNFLFQEPSTAVPPSSTSLSPNSHPNNDDIVDIKDVQLTLLPSYLHNEDSSTTAAATTTTATTTKEGGGLKEQTPSPQHSHQAPSVPRRPPRNGGTNVEGTLKTVYALYPKALLHCNRSNQSISSLV